MAQKEKLRIGNAGGYWGDDPGALARQVKGGHLDYITMDFLAEVTMSIMQKQRARDPEAGYARDFIGMLEPILVDMVANKTKLITNAGGVNPTACAKAIDELAQRLGTKVKISVVHGDDILGAIEDFRGQGVDFRNMETGENFADVADRIESANVYFGAKPVVEALKDDPDIIITGRVTDTGITLAPMIHEFGWAWDDWNKLASGIISGHLMECGCQVTGGNFSDWTKVSSFTEMGYPISTIYPDGHFELSKHPGTGGLVSVDTVREQLVYEMGDPEGYITPDVIADFSSVQLEQAGADCVKVSGVKGCEPTELYKVSMAYRDGFKSVGSIAISGPDARAKAERFAEIFWEHAGTDFEEVGTEYFGWNACHRSLLDRDDGNEIILRLGARSQDKGKLAVFAKLIPSLILRGPPGVTVTGGVAKAQSVVSYWPALMPKSTIQPQTARYQTGGQLVDDRAIGGTATGDFQPKASATQKVETPSASVTEAVAQTGTELRTICLARSGDKGDMANIGVLARSPAAYQFLCDYLTAQRVKDLFQELCAGPVTRYTLDNIHALNFLLDASLGGGGTKTLRIDAQGKTFAQALLRQKAPIPDNVLSSIK